MIVWPKWSRVEIDLSPVHDLRVKVDENSRGAVGAQLYCGHEPRPTDVTKQNRRATARRRLPASGCNNALLDEGAGQSVDRRGTEARHYADLLARQGARIAKRLKDGGSVHSRESAGGGSVPRSPWHKTPVMDHTSTV